MVKRISQFWKILSRFVSILRTLFYKTFTLQQIDGLAQERRNSIANALKLRLSCTNSSIYANDTTAAHEMHMFTAVRCNC